MGPQATGPHMTGPQLTGLHGVGLRRANSAVKSRRTRCIRSPRTILEKDSDKTLPTLSDRENTQGKTQPSGSTAARADAHWPQSASVGVKGLSKFSPRPTP